MSILKLYYFIIFILMFGISAISAQNVDIEGQVLGNSDVEGIHVINRTSSKYTTTTESGSFIINAKLNDTVVFSSVQYKVKAFRISQETIDAKKMVVQLEELVNVLDQVTVGKVLSGDLAFDVENSQIEKPIDFYDVGIPGYTGKKKTQSERRLHEADGGKMIPYVGFGFGVNFHKLLNAISGRTKMLKERVRLESNDVLLNWISDRMSEDFFKANPLEEGLRVEFFYFCSEDENFEVRCKGKSEIEIYQFLVEKYDAFKKNLKSKD